MLIRTARGVPFACGFLWDADIAAACTDAGIKMNIMTCHGLLGHRNKKATRQTAKELGWVLSCGKIKPCKHCAKSKAKQKNVCNKSTVPKIKEQGRQLHLNLSKATVSGDDDLDFEQTGITGRAC